MNSTFKTTFYSTVCIATISLLTACGGGSSSGGGEPSFVGYWSTKCYAGSELQSLSKRMGIKIDGSNIKGMSIKVNNTADTSTFKFSVYSDMNCSAALRYAGTSCSYSNQGQKISSDGKTVNKILTKCPKNSKDVGKDIYLIENGNLYLFNGKGRDSEGYPNEVLYDYYFTKQ